MLKNKKNQLPSDILTKLLETGVVGLNVEQRKQLGLWLLVPLLLSMCTQHIEKLMESSSIWKQTGWWPRDGASYHGDDLLLGRTCLG